MLFVRIILLVTFVALNGLVRGQEDVRFIEVKDLQPEWLVFQGNAYQNYDNQKARAIYFTLDPSTFKGNFLSVKSPRPFRVFVDQKLIIQQDHGTVLLSVDSLNQVYPGTLFFGVFQEKGVETLQTRIVGPESGAFRSWVDVQRRKENFFLDFLVLATIILAVYFVLLFRTNPRLTLDYLNVSKLFFIQEREENLLATRVTSSVNLLFYLFCSLFCALVLLVIFQFSEGAVGPSFYFPIRSAGEGFLQWGKLSLFIVAWLAFKLLIISLFSSLFALRDTSALQYFNFIRVLFFIAGLIMVICLGYFVYYGYPAGPHIGLLRMTVFILSLFTVMIFLKLMTFAPFSSFHLFSYLCASEIIPLVILIKVLLS
jgi:Domain of unknown function (DUF4271)